MKTATLDVSGMLSMLDYQCIEKQFGRLPAVWRATASIASNSVTVEYDETITGVARLKKWINECGFHSTGEIVPKHVCERHPEYVHDHGAHAVPRPPQRPSPSLAPPPPHEHHVHAAHPPAPGAAAPAMPMAHDVADKIGHGAGMDMQVMVRDMRNRFWVSLVFSIPIFIYSPMGMFTPPAPPFGLQLNVWLFLLATAAIIYPAWPFVVAAIGSATESSTWRCSSCSAWGRVTSSASARRSFSKASTSTKHRPCCSSSSCSAIGWRCGRGQGPLPLSPEIAALAMSGSSALAAINALMLKRTKLAGITWHSTREPAWRPAHAAA